MVHSPITGKPATLISRIPTEKIASIYKDKLDVDVKKYFKDYKELFLYECPVVKYRFFYPYDISGDDTFYEGLQKFAWYYQPWKWDYTAAYPFLNTGVKVLDIGCGNGAFLEKLKLSKGCACTGLEFNEQALKICREKGLEMYSDTIEVHARSFPEAYDAVCFFQVLEHIADIDSFMKAALSCLKPGGQLIICVPNNNPYFYRFNQYEALNMPPHHMGWWNSASLTRLGEWYDLATVAIQEESLNRYRYYTRGYIDEQKSKNPFLGNLMRLFSPLIALGFYLNRKQVHVGHILAVFKK